MSPFAFTSPTTGRWRGVLDGDAGKADGDHAHGFDEDVEGGAAGVLEGVANGVADDGGDTAVRAAWGQTADGEDLPLSQAVCQVIAL